MTAKEAVSGSKSELREWMKTASEAQLEECFHHLSPTSGMTQWKIIEAELLRRRHMSSATRRRIVIVAGIIAAVAAAAGVVIALMPG